MCFVFNKLCGVAQVLQACRDFSLEVIKIKTPQRGLWFEGSTTSLGLEALVTATKAFSLIFLFPSVDLVSIVLLCCKGGRCIWCTTLDNHCDFVGRRIAGS